MVKFELEDDEIVALMQCASAGAAAAQTLLGANARPMGPIFEKIQVQFAEQRTPPATAVNKGNGAARSAAASP
jgi:hypothetical protein